MGFSLHAVPTALEAFGEPIFSAIDRYDAVLPLGMERKAFQTSN